MQAAYERYKQSNLSRKTFCQKEGLVVSQFVYWIKRFEKASKKEPAFKELLPMEPLPLATPGGVTSFTRPMMVLDLLGKARLEFYAPVEASFLRSLLLD